MARQARLLRGAHRLVGMAQRELGLLQEGHAGVGRRDAGRLLRCSSRVLSSLSSRLICWLSAEVTTPSSMAARPMLRSSQTLTK